MDVEQPSVPFNDQLCAATGVYWSRFIEARHQVIIDAKNRLCRFTTGQYALNFRGIAGRHQRLAKVLQTREQGWRDTRGHGFPGPEDLDIAELVVGLSPRKM